MKEMAVPSRKKCSCLLKVLTKNYVLGASVQRQTTTIFQIILCCVHARSHTFQSQSWETDSSSWVSCFGDTALKTISKFSWLYMHAASLIHSDSHHCFASAVVPCPPVHEVKLATFSKPHKKYIAGEVRKRDKERKHIHFGIHSKLQL